MKIKSLGRQTDLIFARFAGAVKDMGNYTLIQTTNNPEYYWGNYIVFDYAPKLGSCKKWKKLFDRHFPYYKGPHHYVFTWDTGVDEKGQIEEFLNEGFELESGVVLTTNTLNPPPNINNEITIRKISSDQEWEDIIHLQNRCFDSKFFNESYEDFKRAQVANYRKMSEEGLGHWFGAFLDDKLVGDLGIFYEGKVARYQNVGTDPHYRRKGICGTLVYKAGKIALDEYDVDYLVMEADLEYHAAKIYESVGFKKTEINYALSWSKSLGVQGT